MKLFHPFHSTHQHQTKESNGDGGSSTSKKNLAGTRPEKNTRRAGGYMGTGYNKSSAKASQGDDVTSTQAPTPESDVQCNTISDKSPPSLNFKGQPSKNKSINNGNKIVEGSSGDGSAGSYGSGECGEAGVVDNFPSTGGDGGSKDAQVYCLHEVQYDNQDVITKFLARSVQSFSFYIVTVKTKIKAKN